MIARNKAVDFEARELGLRFTATRLWDRVSAQWAAPRRDERRYKRDFLAWSKVYRAWMKAARREL